MEIRGLRLFMPFRMDERNGVTYRGETSCQSRMAPPKTGHFSRCAPRKNNRARHHILVTHNSTNLICSKWRIIIMATFLTIFPSHFFPPSTVFPHLTTDGQCLHFFVVLLTFSYPFFPSLLCCPFHPYVVVIFSIISPPVPSFHSHFFYPSIVSIFPIISPPILTFHCKYFHQSFATIYVTLFPSCTLFLFTFRITILLLLVTHQINKCYRQRLFLLVTMHFFPGSSSSRFWRNLRILLSRGTR